MYTPAAAKNCVRPESAPLTIFIGIAFAFPSFGDVQWADDFHNLVDISFSEIVNLNWELEISIGLRIEIHLFYINDTSVLAKKITGLKIQAVWFTSVVPLNGTHLVAVRGLIH